MKWFGFLAPVLLLLWLVAGCGVDSPTGANLDGNSLQSIDSLIDSIVVDSVIDSALQAPAADGEDSGADQVEGEKHPEGECSREGMMKHLNLTEEQQAAITEMVEAMKAEGATREEIHTAVKEKLEEYGVEFASHEEGTGHTGRRHGMMNRLNLSEEQQAAITEKVEAMKAEGATREEIHTAVGEMLEEYSIEFADSHEEGAGHAEGEGHAEE